MIEAFLSSVVEAVFTLVWEFILWPIALVLATPGIIIHACVSVLRPRQHFMRAIADGYSSVSAFWEKWVF
jgi:hypothetical protein